MRKLMVYICIAAALAMTGLLSFKALSQSKTAAPAATPPPCTCGKAVNLGGGGTSQNGVIYNCTCGARACAVVLSGNVSTAPTTQFMTSNISCN